MKSIHAEDSISQINSSLEPTLMNITMMNRRTKENKTSIAELWAAIKALQEGSGASIPVPVPAAPVEIKIPEGANIDVNQLAQMFADKNTVYNLEKRLAKCEQTDQEHFDALDNHENRISALEESMRQFSGDVNLKMLNLEELINQMGSVPQGDGGSNVDLGPLQIVITKMQTQLNQKATSSDFESLREALLLKADKK